VIRVGAILAGGRGSRMGTLGAQRPKALLPVANRPLIEHHLETLAVAGIRKAFIVVGLDAGDVKRVVGDGSSHGVSVRYVEQGEPLGSAHAAAQLADLIDEPFVLLLGDYYTAALDLRPLVERAVRDRTGIVLAKHEPDRRALREACALVTGGDGRVRRVIEKPAAPPSDFKGCGVFVLWPEFFDSVRATPRTLLRDEYELMVSLDMFVRDGNSVVAEVIPSWDAHFTRPADVLQCNLRWLDERKRNELLGSNVRVAEGSLLRRVVIGDDAVVARPCHLEEVVIFDGVTVDGPMPAKAIATPEGLVSCA
jgi:glucose-1-phosphate thymidylyltransferase